MSLHSKQGGSGTRRAPGQERGHQKTDTRGSGGAVPAGAPICDPGASFNRACPCRFPVLSGAEVFHGGLWQICPSQWTQNDSHTGSLLLVQGSSQRFAGSLPGASPSANCMPLDPLARAQTQRQRMFWSPGLSPSLFYTKCRLLTFSSWKPKAQGSPVFSARRISHRATLAQRFLQKVLLTFPLGQRHAGPRMLVSGCNPHPPIRVKTEDRRTQMRKMTPQMKKC